MRHDEIPYLEASEMRRKVNEMRPSESWWEKLAHSDILESQRRKGFKEEQSTLTDANKSPKMRGRCEKDDPI